MTDREQFEPRCTSVADRRAILSRIAAAVQYAMFEIDELGLDKLDTAVLRTIIDKYAGGPVGVTTLAASLSEEVDTLEDVCEPFLLQIGFLQRTPRGRVATELAFAHFGLARPGGTPTLL